MAVAAPAEELVDVGRGVTLCYQRFGDPADPPLLLIAGLGQQLLGWPLGFCHMLVERGLHVIRFDNRDSGRSWHATAPPPRRAQLLTRRFDAAQYTLDDMAQDAAGLIDALGVRPAHVVGVSMGGMVAQMLAANHPEHVRSLTSIMSTTGARRAGWIAPSTLRLMFRPPARTREQAAHRALTMWRHIGSHAFELDEAMIQELAMQSFDRDPRQAVGTGRQLAAILKSGDRTRALRSITAPTLVIHGERDRMVHPTGGRATAAAIPGARLEQITGMGHDLPAGVWERVVGLITAHVRDAEARQAPSAEATA